MNNSYVVTVTSTEGTPLLIPKEISDINFTCAAGYDQKLLIELLLNQIVNFEDNYNVICEDIADLKNKANYILDCETREEIFYRLKSIENLVRASKLIDEFYGLSNQKQIPLLNKIGGLINSAMLTPFRSLLEKKYSLLVKGVEKHHFNAINNSMDKSIFACKTSWELNELLCELKIKEFINIGNDGRDYVSEKMFLNIKKYKTFKEVKDQVIQLSNNYAECQTINSNIKMDKDYSVSISRFQYLKINQ